MDAKRFDRLARALTDSSPRRGLLRGLAGAATGLAAARLRGATATKKWRRSSVTAEACIQTGKQCSSSKPRGRKGNGKKGKAPKQLSCDACCQRRVTTNENGNQVCTCVPRGQACTEARECCDGVCTGGVCLTIASTASSPPPVPVCKPDGQTCTAPGQCCTNICNGGVCGRPPTVTCAIDPDACADGFIQCGGSGGADTCYCYRTTEGESRCLGINQLTHPNCAGTPCNSSAEFGPGQFCASLHGPNICCTANICGPACPEFG